MAGLVQVVTQPLSTADPSEKDQRLNESLMHFMTQENLIPSEEESKRRVEVLGKLNSIVGAFIKRTHERKGLMDHYSETNCYQIRTFGSYRLDVHLPGADMDTVVIVTRNVDRTDMFEDLYVHFQGRSDVKDLIKVEEARVPVIKFQMDEFEFDLAMARLAYNQIPDDFDVTDDRHLKNVDQQSVTSLNGVRVTDSIQNLVPTMKTLKFCIRALKLWAKRRGVYKNVLGFLGGISLEIMAARVGQLCPKALPSKLLYYFFMVYAAWKWPQPVGLTDINPNSCDLNLPVWGSGPTEMNDRRHVAPIITPCYPAQNATANVSKSTLKVMMEEFTRARDICKQVDEGKAEWKELFEPLDVFSKYANFLQVHAVAPNKADYDMWKGYSEANLRVVVSYVEKWQDAYLDRAHPCQRNFKKPRADEEAPFEHYWYIGLKFDLEKMKADGKKAPNVAGPVKDFKNKLMNWPKRKDGMILYVTSKKQKDLPSFVTDPEEEEEAMDEEKIESANQQTADVDPDTEGGKRSVSPVKREEDTEKEVAAGGGKRASADGEREEGEREAKKAKVEPAEEGATKMEVEKTEEKEREKEKAAEAKKESATGSSITAELMASLTAKPEVKGEGASLAADQNKEPPKKQILMLDKEQELRIEVDQRMVTVTLDLGHAEVFGSEIPQGEAMELQRCNLAIYTWHGCTLSIRGEPKVCYKGESTPMKVYTNLHAHLQDRRDAAAARVPDARPPRVMVVGPPDTGKSSLVRLLVNYCVREGGQPMLVDLDVAKGRLLVPGCIGAVPVSAPLREIGGSGGCGDASPLAYFYGSRDPNAFPSPLEAVVADLATRLEARAKSNPGTVETNSGLIIDTFAHKTQAEYQLLLSFVKLLQVDTVVVMDIDKLFSDLQRDLGAQAVKVVKLPKSGGVVSLSTDRQYRKAADKVLVKDYLYGSAHELCPRHVTLPFDKVNLYRTALAPLAPRDALPIGQGEMAGTQQPEVRKVEPEESLENKILAVAGREVGDEQGLASVNVAGFVHVQKVDKEQSRVTLLAPNGLPMPTSKFLVGEIDFVE